MRNKGDFESGEETSFNGFTPGDTRLFSGKVYRTVLSPSTLAIRTTSMFKVNSDGVYFQDRSDDRTRSRVVSNKRMALKKHCKWTNAMDLRSENRSDPALPSSHMCHIQDFSSVHEDGQITIMHNVV